MLGSPGQTRWAVVGNQTDIHAKTICSKGREGLLFAEATGDEERTGPAGSVTGSGMEVSKQGRNNVCVLF